MHRLPSKQANSKEKLEEKVHELKQKPLQVPQMQLDVCNLFFSCCFCWIHEEKCVAALTCVYDFFLNYALYEIDTRLEHSCARSASNV